MKLIHNDIETSTKTEKENNSKYNKIQLYKAITTRLKITFLICPNDDEVCLF